MHGNSFNIDALKPEENYSRRATQGVKKPMAPRSDDLSDINGQLILLTIQIHLLILLSNLLHAIPFYALDTFTFPLLIPFICTHCVRDYYTSIKIHVKYYLKTS